jgi:hypothetical protein
VVTAVTLRELVARLETLTHEDRTALECAALAGTPLTLSRLQAVGPFTRHQAMRYIRRLQRQGCIQPAATTPQDDPANPSYEFRYPQLADIVRQGASVRVRMHVRRRLSVFDRRRPQRRA